MEDVSAKMGKATLTFSEEAIKQLAAYKWTGNVRELRNVIERLAILCNQEITAEDVSKYVHPLG